MPVRWFFTWLMMMSIVAMQTGNCQPTSLTTNYNAFLMSTPLPVPVIEPGQSQVLTFDFPNGDAFGSLTTEWNLFPAR